MLAVVNLFGCFMMMALASKLWADVPVVAVMFFYSTAVSFLLLGYWDKKLNSELAARSGYRLMVRILISTTPVPVTFYKCTAQTSIVTISVTSTPSVPVYWAY
jgi:positive regulator of sigma E activity